MKVYLDDQPLAVSPASVAEALVAGRDAAEAGGRLVIEVHADGSPIAPELLDAPPDDNAGITELKLISTLPGPFLRITLLDAVDLLVEIRRAQSIAAHSFQTGNIEDGAPALQNALASWTLIRDVVDKASALGAINPAAVVVRTEDGGERTGATYIEGLAQDFQTVRGALEIQDFTALADVLEGDLDTQAQHWMVFLAALAAAVSPEPENE